MSSVVLALSSSAVGAVPASDDELATPTDCDFDAYRRPVLQSSPNGRPEPDYPEGSYSTLLVIVKCVLTTEGRARNCVVVKGVSAAVDRSVLDWLPRSRWSPVTVEGKATQFGWVFTFRPSPPDRRRPDAGPPR